MKWRILGFVFFPSCKEVLLHLTSLSLSTPVLIQAQQFICKLTFSGQSCGREFAGLLIKADEFLMSEAWDLGVESKISVQVLFWLVWS